MVEMSQKRLDLSFNSITQISGLSKLNKLTDLTLSNNRIKIVDNLDELENLVFLSLNNNKIENIGTMLYNLKQLRSLQVLNCSGNNFLKEQSSYEEFVIYHLRGLKYINSRYIDSTMTKDVYNNEDKYKLEEMEEKGEDPQKKKDDINVKEYQDLKLTALYKYEEKVLSESKDLNELLVNEEYFESAKNMLKENTRALCQQKLTDIKFYYQLRDQYISDFDKTWKKLQKKSEEETLELVNGYLDKKEKVKLAWEDKKPGSNWQNMISSLLKYIKTDLDRDFMVIETDFMHKITILLDTNHKGKMDEINKKLEGIMNLFTDEFPTSSLNSFFDAVAVQAKDLSTRINEVEMLRKKKEEDGENGLGDPVESPVNPSMFLDSDPAEKIDLTPEAQSLLDGPPEEIVNLVQGWRDNVDTKHKNMVSKDNVRRTN